MNLIQEFHHPTLIYLLIPLTFGFLLGVRLQIWKQLRPYAVQAALSKDPQPSLKPFRIRCILAEISAFVFSSLVLIFITHTLVLLTFIIVLLIDVAVVVAVYLYEESLLRRFELVIPQTAQNLNALSANSPLRSRSIRSILFWLMMCMLILALMGPEGPERNTHLRRIPIHATILFDLSRSMYADDIRPTRLEAAKDEIAALLRKSHGDEIGLIYFTDTPQVQSPQTYDVESLSSYVWAADPKSMPSHGTDLNKALQTALRTFDANDDLFYLESGLDLRRVVLITDGETHTGDLAATLEAYKSRRIHIDVIAIGTRSGARLKDDSGAFMQYESQIVISRLQPDKLMQIAETTGGIYTEYNTPENAADTLIARWDGARIDVNPNSNMMTTAYRIPLYQYFLYPAFILFCLFLMHPIFVAIRYRYRKNHAAAQDNEITSDSDLPVTEIKEPQV